MRARRSVFLYPKKTGGNMDKAGYILLADDNATDVEMVRRALAVNKFANEVVVVEDGEEALDYL